MQPLPGDPVALVALAVMVAGTAFLAFSKWPKAYGLGLVILAVFGLQVADGLFRGFAVDPYTGGIATDSIVGWLGFRAQPFLAGDQWWSPFSYMFVHSGLLHIVGNLFILLTAGPVLEDRLGGRAFLIIYFIGGLAAAGTHLLLSLGPDPFIPPFVAAVGASGAIFAVLTATATLYPREELPMTLGIGFIFWLPAYVVLFLYAGFNLVYMFADLVGTRPLGIAWYGHFAGLAVGLVAARLVEKRAPTTPGGAPRGPLPPVDVEALRPLATTRRLQEMLPRIEGLTGAARDDAAFREAWLDRFFHAARCPRCGGAFEREGLMARCAQCGNEVRFAGAPQRK